MTRKEFAFRQLMSKKFDFVLEVIDLFEHFNPEQLVLPFNSLDVSSIEGLGRFSSGEYLDDMTFQSLMALSETERAEIFSKVMMAAHWAAIIYLILY